MIPLTQWEVDKGPPTKTVDVCGYAVEMPVRTEALQLGEKFDQGKLPIHLIPPEAIFAMARRLQIGAMKHGHRNWEKGLIFSQVFSAVMRHMWAWWRGQDFDPGPDLPFASSHLEAALIKVAFLVAFVERGRKDLDDRPPCVTDGNS